VNLLVTNVTMNSAWEVKQICRVDCAGWGWGGGLDDRIMANVECYDDRQKGTD
jgi:hypothetical protein